MSNHYTVTLTPLDHSIARKPIGVMKAIEEQDPTGIADS